ncbi:OmpA family protein [Myxococcota bacterium]|nr:OmpA family protein [Myxococcota bacterium]
MNQTFFYSAKIFLFTLVYSSNSFAIDCKKELNKFKKTSGLSKNQIYASFLKLSHFLLKNEACRDYPSAMQVAHWAKELNDVDTELNFLTMARRYAPSTPTKPPPSKKYDGIRGLMPPKKQEKPDPFTESQQKVQQKIQRWLSQRFPPQVAAYREMRLVVVRRVLKQAKTRTVGCSPKKKMLQQILSQQKTQQNLLLPMKILFKLNKAHIDENSRTLLEILAKELRSILPLSECILVLGHTDPSGIPAYNDWLSTRRAQRVIQFFHQHQLSSGFFLAHGMGSSMPKKSSSNKVDRFASRRVEFAVFLKR